MEELTKTINSLKTKVEQLTGLHQQLKKDKEQVSADNKELLKTIEEQKTTIAQLENNNKQLNEKSTEQQEQVITETKIKINELVQEIDNCIALLK